MSKQVRRAVLACFVAATFYSANADDHTPILIHPPRAVMRSLRFPRPYAGGGVLFNGDDYRKFAAKAEVGLDMEKRKWILQVGIAVQNSRLVSSHDGHIESGNGLLAYRFRGNLSFGGGIRWNRVVSDHNRYDGLRPQIDLGRDILLANFSMRWEAIFLPSALNRSNDRLGGGVRIWIPSPTTNHHLFSRFSTIINELPFLPGAAHRQTVSEFAVLWRW